MKRTELERIIGKQKVVDARLLDPKKRQYMKWSAPIVASVMLPAHAQASPEITTTESPRCLAAPVMEATIPSKCATEVGSNNISGTATVVVKSDSESIEIISIDHNGGSDIQLPSLPVTVTGSSGATIKWAGNSTDAFTCLPITQISFTVTFTCNGAPNATRTFNLTELLAAAIP